MPSACPCPPVAKKRRRSRQVRRVERLSNVETGADRFRTAFYKCWGQRPQETPTAAAFGNSRGEGRGHSHTSLTATHIHMHAASLPYVSECWLVGVPYASMLHAVRLSKASGCLGSNGAQCRHRLHRQAPGAESAPGIKCREREARRGAVRGAEQRGMVHRDWGYTAIGL